MVDAKIGANSGAPDDFELRLIVIFSFASNDSGREAMRIPTVFCMEIRNCKPQMNDRAKQIRKMDLTEGNYAGYPWVTY